MIQPKYNKQNNAIFLGFDSIEINLFFFYCGFNQLCHKISYFYQMIQIGYI